MSNLPIEICTCYLQQDDGIFKQSSKDKKDAANDPGLHGVEPISLGGVGRCCVEDVYLEKNKKWLEPDSKPVNCGMVWIEANTIDKSISTVRLIKVVVW